MASDTARCRLDARVAAGDTRTGMQMRIVMAAIALVLGFAAPLAAQPQASVRLDYERKEGASACPDAGAVVSSVAERLGYEPFDSTAPETVKVTVLRR